MPSQQRGAYTCKAALVVACVAADVALCAAGDFEAPGGNFTFAAAALAVQLALQLACLLLLLLLLGGTTVAQVGLVGRVLAEFRAPLIVVGAYVSVFAVYAAAKLGYAYGPAGLSPDALWDAPLFVLLSFAQKAAGVAYAVAAVGAALSLGDARWYARQPWVAKLANETRVAAATVATAVPAPAGRALPVSGSAARAASQGVDFSSASGSEASV